MLLHWTIKSDIIITEFHKRHNVINRTKSCAIVFNCVAVFGTYIGIGTSDTEPTLEMVPVIATIPNFTMWSLYILHSESNERKIIKKGLPS